MDNGISLIWIFLILFLGLIVFTLAIRFGIKEADKNSVIRPLNTKLLRKIFKKATKIVERNIASKQKRYQIPWIILFNEGDQNQRLPIENAQMTNALPTDDSFKMETNSFVWHFFNRGLVIELQSQALRSGEFDDETEPRWEEFLKLCGSYRPQRPLDSIVISVPAKLILESTKSVEAKLRLRNLAESTSRRIWIAQNRYAMRFAVYLVVSGCEELEGFESFGKNLPKKMQEGMFGWSSPYNSDISYQSNWVDEALNSITSTVSNLSAELVASDTRSKTSLENFLLPSRIEMLRDGLKIYTDSLMGINNFYDPFYFRGIYFSGIGERPYFLKDIFEEKIFPEFGLAKSAHSQKLKNPLMHGVIKWGLIGFVGIWSAGIVFSTVKISQVIPILTQGINGLNKDTRQRSDALALGETLDFSWYKKTAIALIVGLEELSAARLTEGEAPFIIFIPGSWPIFDNLFSRVKKRIESDFAEMGLNTFKRALDLKTSQITGSDYDQLSGRLINVSNSCDSPKINQSLLDSKQVDTLRIESTNEFQALKKIIEDSDELSRAISAMKRLKSPTRSGTEDLKTLTRYSLDTELSGELNGIISLFNRSTNFSENIIDTENIRAALKCSIINGVINFNKNIFIDNPLIEIEKQIVKNENYFLSLPLQERTSDEIITALNRLHDSIEKQEILLRRGGGLWMTKNVFVPNQEMQNLLNKISNNKLLGKELAEKILTRVNKDFAIMKVRYDSIVERSGTEVGVISSINKNGEESFVQTSERIAIRNAVDKLLEEPFMVSTSALNLELTQSESMETLVSWDTNALNEAIRLKKYRSEIISKDVPLFPETYRPVAKLIIDQQISLRLIDLLEQSHYSVDSNILKRNQYIDDIKLYETNLKKLQTLESLMSEMREFDDAKVLNSLIAKDAITRLRFVSKKFDESGFMETIDNSFSNWKGGSGFMRIGFGISDKIELSEVFNSQILRVEQLSNLAKIYLTAIPKEFISLNQLKHWELLNQEIESYKLNDSSKVLKRFENFLTDLLDNFSLEKCENILSLHNPRIEPQNYFVMRFINIRSSVNKRCEAIKNQTAREQWVILSNDYDNYIAGLKPFIETTKIGISPSNYQKRSNASLNNITEFFSRVPDEFGINSLFKSSSNRENATKFLKAVQEIKELFKPILDEKNDGIKAYDLNISFRSNQDKEIFGNRIIDWKLNVGDDSFGLRDEPTTLRWSPGDKISVSFRFAANTAVSPESDSNNPNYQSNRKTATFSYTDTWSLFDLIQTHRIEITNDKKNRFNQHLRFEFPVMLKDNNSEVIIESKSNARVYIMINLIDPLTKKTVEWPKYFPVKSPILLKTLVESQQNRKLVY